MASAEINKLARGNRPLSSNISKIEELYVQREPIYKSLANLSVENNENEYEKTINIIRSGYEKSIGD